MRNPSFIHITIKEINENWDIYYLATSKDIPWFFAESDSKDDIIPTSERVLRMLLKERQKREAMKKKSAECTQDYNTALKYSFKTQFSLA